MVKIKIKKKENLRGGGYNSNQAQRTMTNFKRLTDLRVYSFYLVSILL